jgi:hypothetical protein
MVDEQQRISTFYRRTLGAPLKNSRWAWGAVNPKTGELFLSVWEDERETTDTVDRIMILGTEWRTSSRGRIEREQHVGLMRQGVIAYGVLCVVRDVNTSGPRKIARFHRDHLLALGSVIEQAESVYAVITGEVPTSVVDRRLGIPAGITALDVQDALRRLAAGAPHPFGVSTGWDVVYEERRYPQKAVLGLAAGNLAGRPLGPYDFTAGECRRVLARLGFPPVRKGGGRERREEEEDAEEATIRQRADIGPTEKERLVKARRGQGVFKSDLQRVEKRCRVTGIRNRVHLRASHIKPWCQSTDQEKLDPYNGLLLSPHIDHLFDEGFISFTDSGDLVVADVLDPGVLKTWGIAMPCNIGRFRSEQMKYLDYHRRYVFLGRGD